MFQVSVVIPVIRKNLIPNLERALKDQNYPLKEILIIEDTDRKGTCWARNRGIERASGDWIAFIDDDCIPELNWIQSLVDSSVKYDADVVGGAYIETDPLLYDIKSMKIYPKTSGIDQSGIVAVGGNIMFSRKILMRCKKQYGYIFNENFKNGSEDHELAWRLRKINAKFVFSPSFHKHLKKIGPIKFLKMKFNRGKGIYQLSKSIKKNQLKPFHKSLVWSNERNNSLSKLIIVLIRLIIGPFNMKNFSSKRNFILYWLGEKAKVFGFLSKKISSIWERDS